MIFTSFNQNNSPILNKSMRELVFACALALAVGACNSDTDCSLNGVCDHTTGICACDKPWVDGKTEKCAVLDIVKHPNDYIPAYGGTGADTLWRKGYNTTSWGANIIKGDDDLWHMFVSEMADGVGKLLKFNAGDVTSLK